MKMSDHGKAEAAIEAYQRVLGRLQAIQQSKELTYETKAMVPTAFGGTSFVVDRTPRATVLKMAQDEFTAARKALLEIGVEPE